MAFLIVKDRVFGKLLDLLMRKYKSITLIPSKFKLDSHNKNKYKTCNALVAQWIEHWFPKPGVAGSIPAKGIFFNFKSYQVFIML